MIQCMVNSVQCTVYSVQCMVNSVQCTVHLDSPGRGEVSFSVPYRHPCTLYRHLAVQHIHLSPEEVYDEHCVQYVLNVLYELCTATLLYSTSNSVLKRLHCIYMQYVSCIFIIYSNLRGLVNQ